MVVMDGVMFRFWTEIYQGAKMFYMSGVVNNKYLKNDIRNLTLYISRMKFRPLVWRNTHPYIMVDRFEDLTPAEAIRQDPKVGSCMSPLERLLRSRSMPFSHLQK